MQKIKLIQDTVTKCLEDLPATRNSDFKLYAAVVKKLCPMAYSMNLATAMWHATELNLPKFETVVRTRRKVQDERLDLRCVAEVQDGRDEEEAQFIEWARAQV